jgi:hypothetical protein
VVDASATRAPRARDDGRSSFLAAGNIPRQTALRG